MIRIHQVTLPITHTYEDLRIRTAKLLRIPDSQIKALRIVRQSVDARKKKEISFSYVLDVEAGQEGQEGQIVKRAKNPNVSISREKPYQFPLTGQEKLTSPPVIVGSGPAGLFCGLMLARHGYAPLILERGGPVEDRERAVKDFWEKGELNPESNVQFGEGGAGTFSDGKLNTLVKDPSGRNRKVLETFVEFGADPSVCYASKPHIGTDVLGQVVKGMRQEIIRLGGEVRFYSQVRDIRIKAGRVRGVALKEGEEIDAQALILAIGHSARDTFALLQSRQVPMEAKAFAVGLRIQHPQSMVDEAQCGAWAAKILGAASYKLTHSCANGRGVYSFCMCPGGFVVNASSEEGRLAVNGMSYHARDGENANSALIVTVTPDDFGSGGEGALRGVAFQRRLEEAAFKAGAGRIPVQLYGDFKENRLSLRYGQVRPQFKGEARFANLQEILPGAVCISLLEGIERFGKVIPGFSREDAVLAGVESRTSSPVRICRDEHLESQIGGLFPCGEGAGYAGGITSAAMDGIRVAEEIARRYKPFR